MPLYEYSCGTCGRSASIRKASKHSDREEQCDCGAPLRRIYSTQGLVSGGASKRQPAQVGPSPPRWHGPAIRATGPNVTIESNYLDGVAIVAEPGSRPVVTGNAIHGTPAAIYDHGSDGVIARKNVHRTRPNTPEQRA
jgi:putative FmdB family regulatory protein